MPPRKILVLFAHPLYEHSRVNRLLVDAIRDLPGVTFHDLYEAYPTLAIDVRREQGLLAAHDVVVFQHPFYWYAAPALVKQWQDLVLEHGWAYGAKGRALAGKITLNAITTGGPQAAYREGGPNRFSMRQFLAPFDHTAHVCRMRFLAPFVVHGSLRLGLEGGVEPWAARYRRLLELLRDDRLDLDRAQQAERLDDPAALEITGGAA